MTKRYGRNQKRKHREEIKQLKTALRLETNARQAAEYKAENARNDALEFFMEKSGLMKAAVDKVSYELGRAVGKELQPHAMKMFEAAHRAYNRPPMSFEALESPMHEKEFMVLRGEVSALRYNIVLA